MASAGGSLAFGRAYNSLDAANSTVMGYGWTHNYNMRLLLSTTISTTFATFIAPGGSYLEFSQRPDGTFMPGPGIKANLTRNGDDSYTLSDQHQNRIQFDPGGRATQLIDANGNARTLTYNGSRLASVSDASGHSLQFSYDVNGRVTQVSDSIGRHVDYGYDVGGNLAVITDTRGFTNGMSYDGSHLLLTLFDANGVPQLSLHYDAQRRVDSVLDAFGRASVLTYTSATQTVVADRNGNQTTHSYNSDGLLVSISNAVGQSASYSYDWNLNRPSITDQNGNQTTLRWSGFNPMVITDTLGNPTTLAYDSNNNLIRRTDALGRTSVYTYSGTLLTRATDALGNTTIYSYTAEGFLVAETDPRGSTTRYGYDSVGKRTAMTDTLGNVTTYGYDLVGRLITTTDALGRANLSAYDNADRVLRTTQNFLTGQPQNYQNAFNVLTQYGYDPVGRRILVTDTLGSVTRYEYDGAGRVAKVTLNYVSGRPQNDANEFNIVTQYGYDQQGNQIAITDTLGHVTKTDFDVLNRPITVTTNYLVGQPQNYLNQYNVMRVNGFDSVGNVITQTDSFGHQTVTRYDAVNRPITVTTNYLAGQVQNYQDQYNLIAVSSYDVVGNLITRTDTLGRRTVTRYDSLNRPVTVTTNYVDGLFSLGKPDEDSITVNGYDGVGNIVTQTDALGRASLTQYDALNRSVAVTVNYLPGQPQNYQAQFNLVTAYGYDAVGNRTWITDTLGHSTKSDYDGLNRIVQVTNNYLGGQAQNYQNEFNLVTQYAYDALSHRTVMTDTLGRASKTELDTLYRMAAQVDSANQRTSYGYDPLNNRVVTTDTLGRATQMTYDALSRPLTTTQPLNTISVARYDALGNRIQALDPRGNLTQFGYDALNRMAVITDALGHATTITYDPTGRRTRLSDALGHSTFFGYDLADRQTVMTDAVSAVTRYGYDVLGNRVVMTDANRIVTLYEYDVAARLITVTENYSATGPANNQVNVRTRYGYDAVGNQIVITDARGFATTFGYDTLSRLRAQSDALGNGTSYSYDAVNRRVSMTDAKSQTTQYTYDVLNRLSLVSYLADNTSVAFDYDPVGNRTVMTDSVGVTRWAYDELYRVTQVTDPHNGVVGYYYDAAGNRTNLIYPDSKVVTYTYNALNSLSSAADWTGQTTGYAFDNANRLITTTLPNNLRTVSTYDNANRLTRLTHSSAAGGTVLADYRYAMDAMGNRTVVTETILSPAGGVVQPQRPADGGRGGGVPDVDKGNYRVFLPLVAGGTDSDSASEVPLVGGSTSIVISEVRTRGPLGSTDEFIELFNLSGAPVNVGGWKVRASTSAGKVSTLATLSQGTTLQAGQHYLVAHTGYSNPVPPDLTYSSDVADNGGVAIVDGQTKIDQVGFSTGSAYKEGTVLTPTTTNEDRSYARNGNGCIDSDNNIADFTLVSPSQPQDRNSLFTPCTPVALTATIRYSYDPLYRLTNANYVGSLSAYTFTYRYDDVGNRLVQTRTVTNTQVIAYTYDNANRLTNVGGQAYTWDANGNLLNDGTSAYAYDQANRLKTLTQTATVYAFAYNGVGDRLKQILNGSVTSYTLGLNAGLTQVLYDGTSTYLYGTTRIGEQKLGTWSYHLTDGLGSVRQLTDGAGAVTLARRYDPFGDALTSVGSGTSTFGFAGEQTDATGLEYLRARYYDSETGRFVTKDTWPDDKIHPMSQNPWLYVADDPINATDPTGLRLLRIWASAFLKPATIEFPYVYLPKRDDPTYQERFIPMGPSNSNPVIPPEWTPIRDATFAGDNRDFYSGGGNTPSARNWHSIIINTYPLGPATVINLSGSARTHVGFTYSSTRAEISARAPDPPPALVRKSLLGCQIVVNIEDSAVAGANPLAPPGLTPSIRYRYQIVFDLTNGNVTITGKHSRFPWQELYIEGVQEPPVQDNPDGPTRTPLDLYETPWTADRSIDTTGYIATDPVTDMLCACRPIWP